MSILDIIKNLFCTKKSSNSESITNVTNDIKEEETTPQTKAQDKPVPTTAVPVVKAPISPSPTSEQSIAIEIPQDSTLKRHYISALKAKIETEMGSYPTDETLKRQFNTTVQAKLDDLLN